VKETKYKNYYVTEDGRVISKNRKYKDRDYKEIKPNIKRSGYANAILSIEGKVKHVPIHRLVAETYIPNPNNLPCVNHVDGDKLNNHITNLEWVDYKENIAHAIVTGLKQSIAGEANPKAKINRAVAEQIRTDYKTIKSYRKLAKLYGIDYTSIADIIKFRTWK